MQFIPQFTKCSLTVSKNVPCQEKPLFLKVANLGFSLKNLEPLVIEKDSTSSRDLVALSEVLISAFEPQEGDDYEIITEEDCQALSLGSVRGKSVPSSPDNETTRASLQSFIKDSPNDVWDAALDYQDDLSKLKKDLDLPSRSNSSSYDREASCGGQPLITAGTGGIKPNSLSQQLEAQTGLDPGRSSGVDETVSEDTGKTHGSRKEQVGGDTLSCLTSELEGLKLAPNEGESSFDAPESFDGEKTSGSELTKTGDKQIKLEMRKIQAREDKNKIETSKTHSKGESKMGRKLSKNEGGSYKVDLTPPVIDEKKPINTAGMATTTAGRDNSECSEQKSGVEIGDLKSEVAGERSVVDPSKRSAARKQLSNEDERLNKDRDIESGERMQKSDDEGDTYFDCPNNPPSPAFAEKVDIGHVIASTKSGTQQVSYHDETEDKFPVTTNPEGRGLNEVQTHLGSGDQKVGDTTMLQGTQKQLGGENMDSELGQRETSHKGNKGKEYKNKSSRKGRHEQSHLDPDITNRANRLNIKSYAGPQSLPADSSSFKMSHKTSIRASRHSPISIARDEMCHTDSASAVHHSHIEKTNAGGTARPMSMNPSRRQEPHTSDTHPSAELLDMTPPLLLPNSSDENMAVSKMVECNENATSNMCSEGKRHGTSKEKACEDYMVLVTITSLSNLIPQSVWIPRTAKDHLTVQGITEPYNLTILERYGVSYKVYTAEDKHTRHMLYKDNTQIDKEIDKDVTETEHVMRTVRTKEVTEISTDRSRRSTEVHVDRARRSTEGHMDGARGSTEGHVDRTRGSTEGQRDRSRVSTEGHMEKNRESTEGHMDRTRDSTEGQRDRIRGSNEGHMDRTRGFSEGQRDRSRGSTGDQTGTRLYPSLDGLSTGSTDIRQELRTGHVFGVNNREYIDTGHPRQVDRTIASTEGHMDRTRGSTEGHMDRTRGSTEGHMDGARGSTEGHMDGARGSTEGHMDRSRGSTEGHMDRTRGSTEGHMDRTRGSTEGHMDRTRGSTEGHMDRTIGSTEGHMDRTRGSTEGHMDRTRGSTEGHMDRTRGSTEGHMDRTRGSTEGHMDRTRGSTEGHMDGARGSTEGHMDRTRGSTEGHMDRTRGSTEGHMDRTRGSTEGHMDRTRGSTEGHMDRTRGSTEGHMDRSRGSTEGHMDRTRGSTEGHMDRTRGSTEGHMDRTRGSTEGHMDRTRGSTEGHMDGARGSTEGHMDRTRGSTEGHMDGTRGSTGSHSGRGHNAGFSKLDGNARYSHLTQTASGNNEENRKCNLRAGNSAEKPSGWYDDSDSEHGQDTDSSLDSEDPEAINRHFRDDPRARGGHRPSQDVETKDLYEENSRKPRNFSEGYSRTGHKSYPNAKAAEDSDEEFNSFGNMTKTSSHTNQPGELVERGENRTGGQTKSGVRSDMASSRSGEIDMFGREMSSLPAVEGYDKSGGNLKLSLEFDPETDTTVLAYMTTLPKKMKCFTVEIKKHSREDCLLVEGETSEVLKVFKKIEEISPTVTFNREYSRSDRSENQREQKRFAGLSSTPSTFSVDHPRKDKHQTTYSASFQNPSNRDRSESEERVERFGSSVDRPQGHVRHLSTTHSNIRVDVIKSDITSLTVDAIVNAANSRLCHGGGVAKAISKKAGPGLQKECDDFVKGHGKIPVTGLFVSKGFKLPAKHVIHAVGPRWKYYGEGKREECARDLRRTVLHCLFEANKRGCHSIAIPSISAGEFHV